MNRSWLARHPRAAPIMVFLLVAAITILSVVAIERGEQARERARLSRTADALTASLIRRASTTGAYLRAGSALFETTGSVTSATFARFADELRLDQNFRGAEGIGWAPLLTADQIPAFEADASRELGVSVVLRPGLRQQPRRLLTPVYYLQPNTQRNRRALGFDMYSEQNRRAAMDQAVQRQQPTASAPVILQQEGRSASPGFLIYMPVFADSTGRQLRGFIYSPFGAASFLEAAMPGELEEDNVSVTLLDTAGAQPVKIATLGPVKEGGRIATAPLTIANRAYQLQIRSGGQPMLSTLSMITLLFGMFVASLLLVLVRLMARQAREDQQRLAWFEEQNSIRDSLTRELNHRVKNTLANVLSIVALTRRRASSLDEFADSLDGRIRALSATHDLLTKSEWGTTPIGAVVAAELAPYARGYANMIETDGPAVELAPNDALSLGMALHELATNAAKYGALSQSGGQVSIRWETVSAALARLYWTESGGPAVPQQRSRGFGTDLIQKIVAHELRHPVDLVFSPEGVRCTLLIPIRQPSAFAMRARSAQREAAPVN